MDVALTPLRQVVAGTSGGSEDNPIDALVIGAGPSGMVALRNLLRDDPPLTVMAVERQATPGGLWNELIPEYSTLQDLKVEYEVHGVKFPQQTPARRAPKIHVSEFCAAYVKEFGLAEHVLWQHDVTSVEMVREMLHRVVIQPFVEGLENPVSITVYTRSVLVCSGYNMAPHLATFPGQETATFPIKHNNDVRHAGELPDSDLVVIGAGPSAMDIVQEACVTRNTTNVHMVQRTSHWGAPDEWWPWLWQYGWTEMELLRVLYRLLPIYVVDSILYFLHLFWALLYGVPEWRPPFQHSASSKVGYTLRTYLTRLYKAGKFRIHNNCSIRSIEGHKVILSDGTVLQPKLLVAATGWSIDSSYLPGGEKAGEYGSLVAADADRPVYLRFYDQDHPGIFYVSTAAGFQPYTESASYISQAINQILRGSWTRPSPKEIQRNLKTVVLHHVGLPGLIHEDLEGAGFKNLRGKNVR